MKKIILSILTIVCTFLLINKVKAEEIGCKYKLEADNKTDYVTFYFVKGEGIVDKFKIESTQVESKYPGNLMVSPNPLKIFGDEDFYMDTKEVLGYTFTSDITACPSGLNYMFFGLGNQMIRKGYALLHQSQKENIVPASGTITFAGQIDSSKPNPTEDPKPTEPTPTPTEPTPPSRKNCGDAYVMSLNTYLRASGYDGYSLKIQYYMENDKKYAETMLVKGTTEIKSTKYTMLLHPEVKNYTATDYYKSYGGMQIKIETFDKCEDVKDVKVWKDDEFSGLSLFVGLSGEAVITLDEESKTEVETQEEYEENYQNNYGKSVDTNKPKSPTIPSGPTKCENIIGTTGQYIIKGLITLLQIAGAIYTVVQATLMLLPAVAAHDASELNKSAKKLVTLVMVLLLILLFRPLVKILGNALGFDTSCII